MRNVYETKSRMNNGAIFYRIKIYNYKLSFFEIYIFNINRIYISSKYTANSIINNIKMPVTLIDNVTFYDDKIYHFCFRSWTKNYNGNWESTINNVMASILINDRIDNK